MIALAVVLPGLQATDGAGVVGTVFPGDTERRLHFAVVELADDYWLVDVPLAEFHQYLAVDPGQEIAAPVGTGQGFRHRHPDTGRMVSRSMAGVLPSGVVKAAGIGRRTALPGVLNTHLVIAVAGDGIAGHAHHPRHQRPAHGGFGAV